MSFRLDLPSFTADSPLLRGAFEMARHAHHGPRRQGDTDIDHPVAVAELLHEVGVADKVANARDMRDDPDSVPGSQLDHYVSTVLNATHPDLPFLGEVRRELERIRDARESEPDA